MRRGWEKVVRINGSSLFRIILKVLSTSQSIIHNINMVNLIQQHHAYEGAQNELRLAA